MLLCMRIAACSPDLAQLVEQLLQATPTLGKILLANALGVSSNAIAQRLCIGMFLALSTSNDLVRHGICSIFGFANSILARVDSSCCTNACCARTRLHNN